MRVLICLLTFVLAATCYSASPVQILGKTYTYEYGSSHPERNKKLTINVSRIEITADHPEPYYVFVVQRDGRTYEVKIKQKFWDFHVSNLMQKVSEEKCQGASYEYVENDTYYVNLDRPYNVCIYATGDAPASQYYYYALIPIPSPLPNQVTWYGKCQKIGNETSEEYSTSTLKSEYRKFFEIACDSKDEKFTVNFQLIGIN